MRARTALSTILTIDGHQVSQSLKYLLPEINQNWKVTRRWESPQEMWQELRPWVIGQDGKLVPEVERALDKLPINDELGGPILAICAIRIAAVRWAAKQLEL